MAAPGGKHRAPSNLTQTSTFESSTPNGHSVLSTSPCIPPPPPPILCPESTPPIDSQQSKISSADEDQPGGQGECHAITITQTATSGRDPSSGTQPAMSIVSIGETVETKKPPAEHERPGSKRVLVAMTTNVREMYSVVKKRGIKKLTEILQQKGIRKSSRPAMKTPQDDFKPEFVSSVESLLNRLLEFAKHYDLKMDASQLLQTWAQLVEREILISVFGRFNAGKSTLLNALLETSFLPVKLESETGVKVMIKHSESVHRGPCPEQIDGARKKPCQQCPCLEAIERSTEDVERDLSALVVSYRGAQAIKKALSSYNKDIREEKGGAAVDQEIKVYTNVPAIGGAPDPWSVYLVDNPGCGDANKSLSNLAETSMKSSSAYVYVVHYKELGDANDVESFKHIHAKDPDVFRDERLVVAVTHFDTFYTALLEHDKIPVDVIKQKVCSTVQSAIGEYFPEDLVIPVCSKWAQFARQLRYKPCDEKLKAAALRCLDDYDEDPRGQAECIENLDPVHIADRLEKASGILKIEERVQGMSKSCLDIWIHTIENDCTRYTKEGIERLGAEIKKLEEERNKVDHEHDELETAHGEVKKYYHQLKQSVIKPKKSTKVYQDLEVAYPHDVQMTSSMGEQRAEELLSAFKRIISDKIKQQSYMTDDFETDLTNFLEKTVTELQKLYGNAQFSRMNTKYADQLMTMGDMYGVLRTNTVRFCGTKLCSESSVHDEWQQEENRTLQDVIREHPPKLKDIKVKAEPLLSGWRRLWQRICALFGQKYVHQQLRTEQDLDKPLEELRDEIKQACDKHLQDIRPYVVKHFYKQYADRTRRKLDAFDQEFHDKIEARKSHIDKLQSKIEEKDQEMNMLSRWCKHLQELEIHIHKKAIEFPQAQQQA